MLGGLKEFDAGIAQLVERNLAKVEVASSNLVSRSSLRAALRLRQQKLVCIGRFRYSASRINQFDAGIAQLVERNLAKVEVASSNLVSRSNS